ncbi:ABC transporter ATP-binding protein [Micromonospora zhanjiangensis]|uniref:ABC transporter ATP-binding protein n=1 Tax=Micromonospora zhanjiangensis TaxID=1522057 RepID=A0ABV8KUE2_9ACTN
MSDSPAAPLVELRRVALTYPGPPPVPALRSTDLVIRHGEYLTVVGRSGSGKSTLLNVLGLIDRPTVGSYLFEGVDTGTMRETRRTSLRARRIGLVFQAFHLLPHRTAEENVAIGLLYRGLPAGRRREQARDALARVGLAHRSNATPSQLSGGERQRVAIARALVVRPALLLCDEPTGNLDTATAESVLRLIAELHGSGLTVVMITHDRGVAERAQRQVSITDGRLTELTSEVVP